MSAGGVVISKSEAHPMAEFQVFSLHKDDGRVRDYKRRRAHTKTKSGCVTCRAKRVKCDELRPICARCYRNERSCVYGPSSRDRAQCFRFSVLNATTVIPFSAADAHKGTSTVCLMHHLATHWFSIFNFPCNDDVLTLFKSHTYVRNTILAVAACHLRTMSSRILQHKIAEYFQQSLAFQDLQKLMSINPATLSQSSVNAMMLNGMLLNMLSFALPASEASGDDEPDPGTSWVFSRREDGLDWLALHGGFRHLLRANAAYLDSAMRFLGHILLDPGDDPWAYSRLPSDLEGVPESWIELFRLKSHNSDGARQQPNSITVGNDHAVPTGGHDTEVAGSVFRLPVLALTQSHSSRSVGSNVFHNFTFLSKMDGEFRSLLYQRDESALWLLGYWLGLMSRHEDLWWCGKRVKRDLRAVRMWLDQSCVNTRPSVGRGLWREMMANLDHAVQRSSRAQSSEVLSTSSRT